MNRTRYYTYGTAANHQIHALVGISGPLTASFSYDDNGNMRVRTVSGVVYEQDFDVENRLVNVTVGFDTTEFFYDANGQRVLTIQPNGTKIYTPFPEFEETVPTSGATTQRSSYFLAGQLIAVRVVTGGSSTLYFTFADHLGNVSAITYSGGTLVAGSLARYEPYGGFRTQPTSNPGITDRGFTGHKSNNTGTYDLDLIYMNARYYLPEIGRFISADTIVPDPQNPQSFNRYSYSLNNPINYVDPSGHDVCPADLSERECSSGTNIARITEQPAAGFAFALARVPFLASHLGDPRVAELVPIACSPGIGCYFLPSILPVYLAAPGATPGVTRTSEQKKIGGALSAAGAGADVFSTTISGTYTFLQLLAAGAAGPVGPDDLLVHGAYAVAIDPIENVISITGAGLIIAGDFFSGGSNLDLQARQVMIGQDTVALGLSALAGQFTGQVPIAGAALDTAINLAVNVYDVGRLAGTIPTRVEGRADRSGPYAILYPDSQ